MSNKALGVQCATFDQKQVTGGKYIKTGGLLRPKNEFTEKQKKSKPRR